MSIDLLVKRLTRSNSPVVPGFYEALMLKSGQMLLELVSEIFVVMGVREE